MKKLLISIFFLISFVSTSQTIDFVDTNLKNYLINEICVDANNDGVYDTNADFNYDGEIQFSEAQEIVDLKIDDLNLGYNILSIEDIAHFSNLIKLTLFANHHLEFISGLNLVNLTHFWLDSSVGNLKHIDLSDLKNITNLRIEDVGGLEYLNIQNGSLASENFSLFYTEQIQYACVDDIAGEYDETAWHMINGVLPATDCLAGVAEEIFFKNLNIYPIPASEKIFVEIKESLSFSINWIVLNSEGKTMLFGTTKKNKFEIKVLNLASGIYFLQLVAEDEKQVIKFVKK